MRADGLTPEQADAVGAVALDGFRKRFGGDVVVPSDATYDDARRVWNGMIDRRPAIVVRPTNELDVASAIQLARDQNLPIAIRGGGHSLPGLSTCDDGMVIDLSRIRGATVDPLARTAVVGGGALLGELDDASQAHGLVCPVGVVSHTGVGGLTLGGGMGRLQRKLGFTIDSLRSVQVVAADGQFVRASANENPDLFWAVRGAGANFGVVTSFEFDLHPYDGRMTVARVVHPGTRIREAWDLFSDLATTAPDDVMLTFNMTLAAADTVPDEHVGKPVVTISAFHSGNAVDAERELDDLMRGGSPVARSIVEMAYLDVQHLADVASAWGHRVYVKGGFTDELPGDALERMVDHMTRAGAEDVFGLWAQGGAIARVPDGATAFTGREARFQMSAETQWDDPAADQTRIGWAREAYAIVEPHARTGRYVNDVGDAGPDLARWVYGDEKYDRLVAVKRAWDPDNVFRFNQNIKP